MIPVIIIFIITIITILVMSDPIDFVDFILTIILGIIAGAIPNTLYFCIQTNSNIVEPVDQPAVSETLVNINDTSYADTHGSIRGGLFYIYGSISTDNQQAFNYYVKQDDGSFKLKSAPASDSSIIYTTDTPKVEIISSKCERGGIIVEPWSIAGCDEKPTKYKFYIPEGSITESYKLGGEE